MWEMTSEMLFVSAVGVILFVVDALLWGTAGFVLGLSIGGARHHRVIAFALTLGSYVLIDGFMIGGLLKVLQVEIRNAELAAHMGVSGMADLVAVDGWFLVSGVCQVALGFWMANKVTKPLRAHVALGSGEGDRLVEFTDRA